MKHAMITVIGKDRPGIIAAVTRILFQNHCNLEDVSMTILEGEFAMMVVIALGRRSRKTSITAALQRLETHGALSFFWKDLTRRLVRGEKHPQGVETYLVSAVGPDQTGIVYKISSLLSRFGLNITDLNCKILGHGKSSLYALLLEVDVPKRFRLPRMKKSLASCGRNLGIEIHLKPVQRVDL